MKKFYLSQNDVKYIDAWVDEHKEYISAKKMYIPFSCCRIYIDDADFYCTVILNEDKQTVKITCNKNGVCDGYIIYKSLETGNYKLIKNTLKRSQKGIKYDSIEQNLLHLVFSVFAILSYKDFSSTPEAIEPSLGEKETISMLPKGNKGRKRKDDFVYILKSDKSGNRHFVLKGKRNGPNYEFGVRGHYRKYKNGKVIWVREYIKGKGKHKDTKYKLRKEPKLDN